MRVLITGMNGFAGSHLADYLLTLPNIELFGGVFGNCDNLAHLKDRATWQEGNLTDPRVAQTLLDFAQPDSIYHLAGQAFPPISWQDPWATIEINIRSQVNLLNLCAQKKSTARILVIGSIEEYGRVDPRAMPVTEATPLRPDSPYGVSKIAQDFLGLQYFQSHHLHIVRVRPSNHIGPRQNEQFVTSNFAKQIAEIEAGAREPILSVGNLTARRDFTDVRDMMRAYVLALARGEPGEVYNIGSGHAVPIQDMLNLLLQQSARAIEVRQDPARLRPSDTPIFYCDASKFRAQTGWQPEISLEQSLKDILDYWRAQIQSPKEK
ncbi:MAG: GDP-mannose 4,6-dehydratase [Chloroflexi bacterium]|nr:GDP-mannose 4,6-dehydratase [Chloroflexota bacterium]